MATRALKVRRVLPEVQGRLGLLVPPGSQVLPGILALLVQLVPRGRLEHMVNPVHLVIPVRLVRLDHRILLRLIRDRLVRRIRWGLRTLPSHQDLHIRHPTRLIAHPVGLVDLLTQNQMAQATLRQVCSPAYLTIAIRLVKRETNLDHQAMTALVFQPSQVFGSLVWRKNDWAIIYFILFMYTFVEENKEYFGFHEWITELFYPYSKSTT